MRGNGKIGNLAPVSVLMYGVAIEGLVVPSVVDLLVNLDANALRVSLNPI